MKKFIAFLTSIVLIVSLLPLKDIGTVYAVNEGIGKIKESINSPASHTSLELSSEPDFTGYTEISTKQELNAVRNNLSGKYVLTADIVFTEADFAKGGDFYNNGQGWMPIGTESAPFTGLFDGNGHTIKGLKINIESDSDVYAGLFAYVSGGTIQNLGMLDSQIKAISASSVAEVYAYASGIAVYVYDATISNCYNTGSILASLTSLSIREEDDSDQIYSYASGIAAYVSNSIISDCYNTGNVKAEAEFEYNTEVNSDSYAGGIAAKINGGKLSNCYNTGNVSADASTHYAAAYAGGIVGSTSNGTISDCYNMGNVVSNAYAGAHAGGIAGYFTNGSCTITNCHNVGTVSGSPAGGIVGGISNNATNSLITYCYNIGAAISDKDENGGSAAGIVGHIFNSSSKVNFCYNHGKVISASAQDIGIAGGIAGYASESTISNCFNTGTLSINSGTYSGGIVGRGGLLINCYNIGIVDVTKEPESELEDAYIGGIAGELFDGSIKNCYYLNSADKGVGDGADTAVKCTDAQMKQQSTFVGFDFNSVWTMAGDDEYPYPELQSKEIISGSETTTPPITEKPETTQDISTTETEPTPAVTDSPSSNEGNKPTLIIVIAVAAVAAIACAVIILVKKKK